MDLSQLTDLQLVEGHQQLKASTATLEKAHAAKIGPLKQAMTAIENEFLKRLDERGADNTKTDAGTAYKSTLLNVKVVDRDAFLKFCTAYWGTIGADMLNVTAVKDPVREYMNGKNMPPPGVETSQFVRINVRRKG
jgi:hypothetical protein